MSEDALRTREAAAEAQIGLMWQEHAAALTKFAQRTAPQVDADDVVSIVFENTFKLILQGKGPESHVRGYLYSAARREILRARERQSRLVLLEGGEGSPLDSLEETDPVEAELLNEVLGGLAPRDRMLMTQIYGEGRSVQSVAAEVGMEPAAVSRRLYKVKPRLKAAWVQRHIQSSDLPLSCQAVLEDAGVVLVGTAPPSVGERFFNHVNQCQWCPPRIREASMQSRSLVLVWPALATPVASLDGLLETDASRFRRRAAAVLLALGVAAMTIGIVLHWQGSVPLPEGGHGAVLTEEGSEHPDGSDDHLAPAHEPTATLPSDNAASESGARNPLSSFQCSWSTDTVCDRR